MVVLATRTSSLDLRAMSIQVVVLHCAAEKTHQSLNEFISKRQYLR